MGKKIDFPTKSPAFCALERIAYELGELVDECEGVNGRIIRAIASPIEGAIKAGTETIKQWKKEELQ